MSMIRIEPMAFGAPSPQLPVSAPPARESFEALEPSLKAVALAKKPWFSMDEIRAMPDGMRVGNEDLKEFILMRRGGKEYQHKEKLGEGQFDTAYGAYDSYGVGEFKERYRVFQASPLKAVAEAWENNALGEGKTFRTSELKAHAPGILPDNDTFPGSNDPVFTYLLESGKAVNVFPETTAMGFTVFANAATAFPDAGSGAGSSGSLFHLLVVPNFRVYNAVTLNKERCRLLHTMRDFFAKPNTEAGMATYKQRIETCVRACRAVNEEKTKTDKAAWTKVYDDMWNAFKADPNWLDTIALGKFLHVHNASQPTGDHSVGQLHMHVFPVNKTLRTNYEHDHKCCAVETVIQAFQHDLDPW